MKQIFTTSITTLVLCSFTLAAPFSGTKGKTGRTIGKSDNIAERIALIEDSINDQKDSHTWQKDENTRDYRPDNIQLYTNHTYRRIVHLLKIGALEESDGTVLKAKHADIIVLGKAANEDGISESEEAEIRRHLNDLNDQINASIIDQEEGTDRTPLVNKAQHRFEEMIEAGVKNDRLSTLEASSLRRKLAKLETKEASLKAGELSTSEHERLIKEVMEIRKDLMKALTN
ncbi:MAG: hypothetical protein ACSHX0_00665 [Akkermansiaceae bacterium]